MPAKPQDLLSGYVEVSSLPMMYTRINDAIGNPRMSMGEIGRVISEDAGLSARLLRIVNSAFYGFPSRVETITRAVTIVGTQQLRALALATSVMNMFKGIPHHLVNMESFWKHSVACGLAARSLASYRREPNPELFFSAGILHDIGRLILYIKVPDLAKKTLERAKAEEMLLFEMERDVIGFDHGAMGRALVQCWKLPPSLEEVVAFHNSPANATRYPVETAIVHIADIIAHVMMLGTTGERFVPPLYNVAWELLGLQEGVLAPVIDQVAHQFEETVELMFPSARA
jgi:HD-like signal output (HDOD) protein